MCRIPRGRSEADIYHVYLRGSGRQLIYESDQDRRFFLHILTLALRETDAQLYAYTLMGNHYHLIVKIDFNKLPAFAYRLNGTYATYFNDHHGRQGHLFESRYKSQPIDSNSYFLEAIRYVHRNPVAAHMAPTCADYPWSSYSAYFRQVTLCNDADHPEDQHLLRPTIPDTAKALDMLGGQEAFQEFHSHPCKEKLADDRPYAASLTESDMIEMAREALQGLEPSTIKSLPKQDRDQKLRLLKLSMLTQPQIALVTGICQSTVSRA